MADWQFVALVAVAGLFCVARGIADLRARRYVWSGLGIAIGLAVLCVPVQTRAVKIDLPAVR